MLDVTGRVLVLGIRNGADGSEGWFLPGGGIEPGETPEQAARRELREELSLANAVELVGPLWTSNYEFSWNGRRVVQQETWFALPGESRPVASLFQPEQSEQFRYIGARWLTLDEISRLEGLIAPADIVELLRGFLASRPPATAHSQPNPG